MPSVDWQMQARRFPCIYRLKNVESANWEMHFRKVVRVTTLPHFSKLVAFDPSVVEKE